MSVFRYEHLFEHDWIPKTEGVRTQTHKYTRYFDTNPKFEEVFDLQRDPLEETNLIKSPVHQRHLEGLVARWNLWRNSLQAWKPNQQWHDPS